MAEKKNNTLAKWAVVALGILAILFSWGMAFESLRAADATQCRDISRMEKALIKLTDILERHEAYIIVQEHESHKKDKP